MTNNASYLQHIDGLRAIALMGVLLFHFEVHPFHGGYAGVDVFLTISGYLITRNVLSHHSDSSPFSLTEFYSRRFFRLYPAATVTVLLSVLAAVAVLPDDLVKEASQSGLAAMLISANTFFHLKSGYFDTSATVKPLLHMWSLSLEEQFYLLWAPLILIHFMMFSSGYVISRMKITLGTLTVASLAGGAFIAVSAPSFAFFHLPSRIFQFSVGAALAAWQTGLGNDVSDEMPKFSESNAQDDGYSIVTNISTFLAIVILTCSYAIFSESAPPLAMLPVNLATLVLLAFPDAPICRYALSSTVAVFLGRLSYSAYLVHWPLYVFSRFVQLALGMGKPHPIVMTIVTILLALVLKKGVEDPGRSGGRTSRVLFCMLAIITLVFCFKTSTMKVSVNVQMKGQTERNANFLLYGTKTAMETRRLVLEKEKLIAMHGKVAYEVSRTGDTNSSNTPQITFVGNSFTHHLAPALYLIGKRKKMWFRLYTGPGCSIVAPSKSSLMKSSGKQCKSFNDVTWKEILKLPQNSTVVLAALWKLTTLDSFLQRLMLIAEELGRKNLNLVFLGEPPGLADEYESYFRCLDLLEKPIGRILNPARNGAVCGLDLNRGAKPIHDRLVTDTVYREAFEKHIFNMRFINVMEEICNMTRNDKNETVDATCKLPTHPLLERFPALTDPGYKNDLKHMSILGGGALSYIYEGLLHDFL